MCLCSQKVMRLSLSLYTSPPQAYTIEFNALNCPSRYRVVHKLCNKSSTEKFPAMEANILLFKPKYIAGCEYFLVGDIR